MSNSNGVFKTILLLSATGILGACGGGGGGGGGGGTVGIAASAPVTIASANAQQVASSTFGATDGLTGSTDGAGGLVPAAVGQIRSTQINIVETIIEQARQAPDLLPISSSGVAPAAVQSLNQNCDTGSISGTFNDNDNDLTLSTGDTVSMTANNCDISGTITNGSISLSNVVVTGDELSPPYSLQFRLQATNFSVSVAGETVVMGGDGTISESSNDGINITSSVSGNGIEITAGGESLILTDYNIQETENQATGAYSISINATVSSSSLGGSVIVTTDVALTGVGAFDADSGQITCVGAGNTRVTVIVVDSVNVQLEVDQNGDGITDATLSAAWVNL